MQAESLAAATDPDDARRRLQTLQAAVRRNTRLVEQLLALARSQHADIPMRNVVSLRKLATEAIQDSVNVANAKGVDLGLKQVDDLKLDLGRVVHHHRTSQPGR